MRDILTEASLSNAMVVHAAFGGSTNLLLHMPAIAHAAGLPRPAARRLGGDQPQRAAPGRCAAERPAQSPDGAGVPRRRRAGSDAASAPGGAARHSRPDGRRRDARRAARRVGSSERRTRLRQRLRDLDGVDPDDVIMSPEAARRRGLTSTDVLPVAAISRRKGR